MPSVPSGLVLVTCAASFVGEHVVRNLLGAGYAVRCAVGTSAEAAYLRGRFRRDEDGVGVGVDVALVVGGEGGVGGRLAAWSRREKSYTAALAGVDAVVHAAGPCDTKADGNGEGSWAVARPAVDALHALLRACRASGVKRVVLMSSVGAVGGANACCGGGGGGGLGGVGAPPPPLAPGQCLTENDWNDAAVVACDTYGVHAPPDVKCSARRTLTERAFWKWISKHPTAPFDGVAINAAVLFGPPAGFPPCRVLGSNALLVPWLRAPLGDAKLDKAYWPHADVRDAAEAAVRSLACPLAPGQRFIVCAGATFGNDLALAAQRVGNPVLTPGNPDPCYRAALARDAGSFSSAKARAVLGLTLRCIDETLGDAVDGIQPLLCGVDPANA